MSFEDLVSPASGDRFETYQTSQPSRRELRDAERARTEAVAVDPFIEIAKVASQRVEPVETSPASVPRSDLEVVGSRSRNAKKSGRA